MYCNCCSHWQGTVYSEWADCYRVIFALEPKLKDCRSTNEGMSGTLIWVPFAPQDVQYFNKNSDFRRLMRQLKKQLPPTIKLLKFGKYDFFQTRKDHGCPLWTWKN